MRAVVADTAPLNQLVLIAAVAILPRLYESVLIPQAVRNELAHPNAPQQVRDWIAQPPSWLIVRSEGLPTDPVLSYLDPGESEAIALASILPAALLLMDDREGSIEARRRGLKTLGTLGVLDEAASRGWIDLPEMFRLLNSTSFRSPRRLMALMLEENARRTRQGGEPEWSAYSGALGRKFLRLDQFLKKIDAAEGEKQGCITPSNNLREILLVYPAIDCLREGLSYGRNYFGSMTLSPLI